MGKGKSKASIKGSAFSKFSGGKMSKCNIKGFLGDKTFLHNIKLFEKVHIICKTE